MTPKSTSAAEIMLARTGRRMAVSESFMCENFPGNVNRSNGPQRNGTAHALVPLHSSQVRRKQTREIDIAAVRCTSEVGPNVYRRSTGRKTPTGARQKS